MRSLTELETGVAVAPHVRGDEIRSITLAFRTIADAVLNKWQGTQGVRRTNGEWQVTSPKGELPLP